MSLTLKVRIGRKDTVRLPKSVVKALKLNPRRKVLVNVLGNIATLQSLRTHSNWSSLAGSSRALALNGLSEQAHECSAPVERE